jgi:hypothetical protein
VNIKRTFGIKLLSASLVLGIVAAAPSSASANQIGIVNPSFENATSHLNGWTTIGSGVYPATSNFGVVFSPPDGIYQAVISKEGGVTTLGSQTPGTLTNFLGVTDSNLASAIGDLSDFADSYGAAIKQHFNLNSPSKVNFDYNLFTLINSSVNTYPETIVAVLDGQSYFVSDTATASFPAPNNDTIFKWAGYHTFTGLPTLAAGAHDISVAAVGTISGAGFELDNFVTTAVPEPASIVLAALGLAGLGFAARRKKNRRT